MKQEAVRWAAAVGDFAQGVPNANPNPNPNPSPSPNPNPNPNPTPNPNQAPPGITEETRVLVNNAAVRHVIGKAGAMIHKLEQEAGAWISIQSEREMQAEARRARKVIIKGSCEARSKAL